LVRGCRRLTTESGKGIIKVWDTATREVLRAFDGHTIPQQVVDLSADGKLVANVARNGPARVWSVDSGALLMQFLWEQFPQVRDLAFSPDGRTLALGRIDVSLRLFDTHTWQEQAAYRHHGHQLNTIAFSPTENILVSAGEVGTIMAWDAKPRPTRDRLAGHPWFVTSVVFSPRSRLLGVGCGDGSVTLWNPDTGSKLLTIGGVEIQGRTEPLRQYEDDFFAFSPDGERMAVTAPPNQVNIWDLRQQKIIDTLTITTPTRSLAYSPDGRLLATGCDGSVHLWNVATSQLVRSVAVSRIAECLAFSPDSRVLACEDWGKQGVKLWDAQTGDLIKTLSEFVTPIGDHRSLAFSPSGEILAVASYDGRVLIWETETWTPRAPLPGDGAPLMDLSFSPDGKRLAASGYSGEAKVWSVEDGREVATFPGWAVDFSPDGNILVIGGLYQLPFGSSEESTTVRLYRAPALEEISDTSEGG
jgi:WD40 repeat protein